MSDNWIILIPEDPQHVPDSDVQALALAKFWGIAPNSDEIESTVSDSVSFFDCGANLERILCPGCEAELSCDWRQERMDEESGNGMLLRKILMPCCGFAATLHELKYDWPQGFGRFSIEAMNPDIGPLSAADKDALEEILSCRLRVIYQHI